MVGSARGGLAARLVVMLGLVAGCVGPTGAAGGGPDPACAPWTVRPVATGLGVVENLVNDGRGGLVLSLLEAGELRRLSPDGTVATVAGGLPAPGGLARRGPWIYVTTGLTTESGLQGVPDGTIERVRRATGGRRQTWATGLVSPNGLALLPDGSAVTTRTLSGAGVPSEITRVPAGDRTALEPLWSDLTVTNGAAVDPTGRWLYVSRSLSARAEVWRIRTNDPQRREMVADLGAGATELLDDLTVTRDGMVYVAAWGSGTVHRVDPRTGRTCPIATALPQASAVEPGRGHLYVSSHTGTVYELTPSA